MSEKLGSFNDFVKENNLSDKSTAFKEYTIALGALRESIAASRGITLEQLHMMSLSQAEADN
ncbi:MAG: hypothetical protein WCJ05_01715 [bacterium]